MILQVISSFNFAFIALFSFLQLPSKRFFFWWKFYTVEGSIAGTFETRLLAGFVFSESSTGEMVLVTVKTWLKKVLMAAVHDHANNLILYCNLYNYLSISIHPTPPSLVSGLNILPQLDGYFGNSRGVDFKVQINYVKRRPCNWKGRLLSSFGKNVTTPWMKYSVKI